MIMTLFSVLLRHFNYKKLQTLLPGSLRILSLPLQLFTYQHELIPLKLVGLPLGNMPILSWLSCHGRFISNKKWLLAIKYFFQKWCHTLFTHLHLIQPGGKSGKIWMPRLGQVSQKLNVNPSQETSLEQQWGPDLCEMQSSERFLSSRDGIS